jgi:segregation and condensation protein B
MKKLVEAAMFLAGRTLTLEDICKAISIHDYGKVKEALEELRMDYAQRDSPIDIIVEKGNYKMELRKEYLDKVKDLAPQMDMSKAVLKALSFIAFKQPVKQSLLVEKFGNRAYDYVKELQERSLISAEKFSRTKLLTTTKNLLTYLGEEDEDRIQKALNKARSEAEREMLQKQAELKAQKQKIVETKLEDMKELSLDDWEVVVNKEKNEKKLKTMEDLEKAMEAEAGDDEDDEFAQYEAA